MRPRRFNRRKPERVELGIKNTKSMKEDLQKLCSQLEKDFENLISKTAKEKK